MTATSLTLRLSPEVLQRLNDQSNRAGRSSVELAQTLLDEGLRMAVHPGIVFRDGPAGRRAGLANGPDVWEIVSVLREVDVSNEAQLRCVGENTNLSLHQIRDALQYYAAFSEEIDALIRQNDALAADAEAEWHRDHCLTPLQQ